MIHRGTIRGKNIKTWVDIYLFAQSDDQPPLQVTRVRAHAISQVAMENPTIADFMKLDIRCGTIVTVESFPEARKPAWKMRIDFGPEIGVKKSSAQITDLYAESDLLNKKIMAVVNFPPRQIGPFVSEVLVLGFPDADGAIVLGIPDGVVPNGARLV